MLFGTRLIYALRSKKTDTRNAAEKAALWAIDTHRKAVYFHGAQGAKGTYSPLPLPHTEPVKVRNDPVRKVNQDGRGLVPSLPKASLMNETAYFTAKTGRRFRNGTASLFGITGKNAGYCSLLILNILRSRKAQNFELFTTTTFITPTS